MKEFFQKLFLILAIISSLFSGFSISNASSYTITNNRIEFPSYKLSILQPPEEYDLVEKGGEELIIWRDHGTSNLILILTSKKGLYLTNQENIKSYAEFIRDLHIRNKEKATYEITEEKETQFNKKKFYQAKIIIHDNSIRGMENIFSITSLLYLYRSSHFTYFFAYSAFHDDEKIKLILDEMMKSVIFLE